MIKLITRTVLLGNYHVSAHAVLANAQQNPKLPLSLLCASTRCLCLSGVSNDESFVVSYLINTCGLSPESALSASKRVSFVTKKQPDSVIRFLKLHGFSKTQISKAIKKFPPLLVAKPEKTLSPKFEFFLSRGISSHDLAFMISECPYILKRHLKCSIIPFFEYLKSFLNTDMRTVKAMKRGMFFFYRSRSSNFEPNISVLRKYGVPDSTISFIVGNHAPVLFLENETFREVVEEVKEMGFNPRKTHFVVAIVAKITTSKPKWERKVDIYKKWGWSEEVILEAFRRHPWIMAISEEKIIAVMDFFVIKMCWNPIVIAKRPLLLSLSLEKRLIPRAAVIRYLVSRGLIEDDFSYIRMFQCTEKIFLQKYVNRYKEAPQLLELYHGKMNSSR